MAYSVITLYEVMKDPERKGYNILLVCFYYGLTGCRGLWTLGLHSSLDTCPFSMGSPVFLRVSSQVEGKSAIYHRQLLVRVFS